MEHVPIYIALLLGIAIAAPADDPLRIGLPVYEPPKEFFITEPSVTATAGSRTDFSNVVGNLLARKLQGANEALSQIVSSKSAAINVGSFLAPPVTIIEHAALEQEGIPSQALSIKENLQHFVAGIFQPKPLVDTIREDEKYGNNGDKFYSAGRAIVGGAAGVSNLVNSVLEIPGTIVKQIARGASEKLNNLGGKLIGL